MVEVLFHLVVGEVFNAFASNDDHILMNQVGTKFLHQMAQTTLDGVSRHGIAEFFTDGQAQTEVASATVNGIDHKLAIGKTGAIVKNALKIPVCLDTITFLQTMTSFISIITIIA